MANAALYLWVAVGSALGGVLRFWLNGVISQRFETFPMGTLVINVTGSFLIGFIYTYTGTDGRVVLGQTPRTFLMTGICGGYTTFSAFSLQTLNLVRETQWLYAGLNMLGSVGLCLIAVWLGHVAAQFLNR